MHEELETVELDAKNGIVKVNGKTLSDVSYFKLEFDGCWCLTVTEDFYPRGNKKTSEKPKSRNKISEVIQHLFQKMS